MSNRAKIAVSLDPSVVARVERLRRRTGESRSAVVGRALASLLDDEANVQRAEDYVRAYRERPESISDIDAARASARAAVAHLAWDDE